jgi:hypothetical protein
MTETATETPTPTAESNPYPHGATIRRPMNWEEATLVKHWDKANARVNRALQAFKSAQAEAMAASNKLHRHGMLVANPAPEVAPEPASEAREVIAGERADRA